VVENGFIRNFLNGVPSVRKTANPTVDATKPLTSRLVFWCEPDQEKAVKFDVVGRCVIITTKNDTGFMRYSGSAPVFVAAEKRTQF
jgi:hypothetical protein